MGEIEEKKLDSNKDLSSKNQRNTFSLEKKNKPSLKSIFEKNHQAAISEVSSWPDWQVKSMQMLFPERKDWKIKGQPSHQTKKGMQNTAILANFSFGYCNPFQGVLEKSLRRLLS